MSTKATLTTTIAAVLVAGLALTGCSSVEADAYKERQTKQTQYKSSESLELQNLTEKRTREDDPNAIRYVYLMSFGQITGYYVSKGKISSNGSQLGPEQEVVQPYSGSDRYVVDSAQDDGSFGVGDPGIFFFTTGGAMIVTDLDYVQSDVPINIDVPRLGGAAE